MARSFVGLVVFVVASYFLGMIAPLAGLMAALFGVCVGAFVSLASVKDKGNTADLEDYRLAIKRSAILLAFGASTGWFLGTGNAAALTMVALAYLVSRVFDSKESFTNGKTWVAWIVSVVCLGVLAGVVTFFGGTAAEPYFFIITIGGTTLVELLGPSLGLPTSQTQTAGASA